MTDIITLGIRIDPSGVISGVSIGEQQFNRLANAADRTVAKVSAIDKGFGALKRQILAFASIGTALKVFSDFVEKTTQAETSQRRLEGTLRATAHAAGLTGKEISDLAEELQRTTLVDDSKVKDAEAVLLTFRNIQGDTFREAIKLANDLAFTMGGDLTGAALQVGKALADPVQGIGALGRAGVKLSDEQEAMIKQFVKVNDLAGAQGVIINALTRSFGGNAAGAAQGLTGAVHSLSVEYTKLLETLGSGKAGGILGTTANTIAAVLSSLRRSADTSPEGRLAKLSDEIERQKRIDFHPLDAAGRGERDARVRSLTIQFNEQAMALAKVEAAERGSARAQGETAAAEQKRSEARGKLMAKREEELKKIKELVAAMSEEAATLGQSSSQARLYELRMLGASKSTLAMAKAQADLSDAFNNLDLSKLPDFSKQLDDFFAGKGQKGRQPGDEHMTTNQRTLRDIRWQTLYGTTDPKRVQEILAEQSRQGVVNEVNQGKAEEAEAKNQKSAAFFEAIWKRAAENSQDALAGFFEHIGSGLDGAVDLLKNFVQTMLKMISQIAAARIFGSGDADGGWFGNLLKGLIPGGGGSGKGNKTQQMHSGGRVGVDGLWRSVDPSVFIGAQRYHGGGMPGLRAGEIPIIAERGEGILSKAQMAAMGDGGGGGAMVVNFNYNANVQALDQRGVDEVLQQHGATIASLALQAVSESGGFRRGMRGRR